MKFFAGRCKLLQGYGDHIQYSIFRCALTMREREKLRWELEKILTAEDSLLLAGLCDRCLQRAVTCNRPGVWDLPTCKHRIY